ncbi:class I SAM-dependent methyltransferase [Methanothermococcus okinawensis]|uniref:Methyltransferase type 11 n=1 Tax=Methanothermococcus okinawensis (strain DSM 14208 / JCM 11175 / IH1) TaxID=647113 RepID=F8AKZ8_METOI|nr:class I SAM-dependent methyltransferase [Methanothermococcus okinawensis]AEH06433.1 Methyltransferase type 11 [Methanothermococcus okinawensis IH1]
MKKTYKNNDKTPFDRYAKEYDKWYDENEQIYKAELDAIKKFIPKSDEKKKGLEIGVGTGRFAKPLGIEYGLEPSKSMAEIAKKRGINVYEGIAEDIPFDDESYDYVLMTTTLCFLNDPIKGLKEIKRILKPNGVLIIGMIDKNSPLGKFYESKKEKSKFYKYAKFYSLDEVLNWLKELNYKNIIYNSVKISEMDNKGSFVVIYAEKL